MPRKKNKGTKQKNRHLNYLFDEDNDDNIIGGHNMAGGSDEGDLLDGGAGDDELEGNIDNDIVPEWTVSDKFDEKELDNVLAIPQLIQNRKWAHKIKVEETNAATQTLVNQVASLGRITSSFNIGETSSAGGVPADDLRRVS